MPSMRVKSTPLMRESAVRPSKCGSWRRAFLGRRLEVGAGLGWTSSAVTGVEGGFAAGVARGDGLRVDCVACQGLAPMAEHLVAPVTLQTVGDGGGAGFAARVFAGRARGRVACAGQQCAEHGPARHTAEVPDDMGPWPVHCGEGLLPVLDAGRSGADEGVALASVGPPHAERSGGTQGAGEQTAGLQLLPPRAVGDVGCAAGPALGMTGMDQVDCTAPCLQDLEEGDPGPPGALHHDRLKATGLAPSATAWSSAVKRAKRRPGAGERSRGTAT